MQTEIRVHSTLRHLFVGNEKVYKAKLIHYGDIVKYLTNVHPLFAEHMRKLNSGEELSHVLILDKNYKSITEQGELITKVKNTDVFYICPVFSGERGIVDTFVDGITNLGKGISKGVRQIGRGIRSGWKKLVAWFKGEEEIPNDPDVPETQGFGFGKLQMTAQAGNRIPIILGQDRIAGQFIAGTKLSFEHGEEDDIDVGEKFNITATPTSANKGNIVSPS